ncbi:hypothetical protein DAPPUDRAFT_328458 [Daphnia pulex]|uniref:Uncharacterized protein n=1 Tax=Daphnia pulex TaxID=6669 RepID=E9HDR3_DAPPU|nr:hypothetical protein DAPPUDRAFT_328458 [Daphnia pulex]|eukprot:EFX70069.1 hypothetical protein DAPPUDRAFT_328458 [Daphnia pulex]
MADICGVTGSLVKVALRFGANSQKFLLNRVAKWLSVSLLDVLRDTNQQKKMMPRHWKEEFIIKNSVNGGAPLSRWKLRDDIIPILFLGNKDGVAPSKNYWKQTTSPLSNNACHKQPKEKFYDRTTSDVNSVEVTLGGENGLEHTTQGTRGENKKKLKLNLYQGKC